MYGRLLSNGKNARGAPCVRKSNSKLCLPPFSLEILFKLWPEFRGKICINMPMRVAGWRCSCFHTNLYICLASKPETVCTKNKTNKHSRHHPKWHPCSEPEPLQYQTAGEHSPFHNPEPSTHDHTSPQHVRTYTAHTRGRRSTANPVLLHRFLLNENPNSGDVCRKTPWRPSTKESLGNQLATRA